MGEVVVFSERAASRAELGQHLLVIDVINAAGRLILQTVWATEADFRRGLRRTDFETIADSTALIARLAVLAPIIARDPFLERQASTTPPVAVGVATLP